MSSDVSSQNWPGYAEVSVSASTSIHVGFAGCLGEGRREEAERYTEHLVDQAALVLRHQPIEVLVVTPASAGTDSHARRARRTDRQERACHPVGAALISIPTRGSLLRTELFPSTGIYGMYGNTMILGGGMERPEAGNESLCEFDAFSPYTTFSVVDPGTLADVAEGERGQVVMHHVSKSLLLPNNLERDLATRIAAPPGALGVSVADVAPVPEFPGHGRRRGGLLMPELFQLDALCATGPFRAVRRVTVADVANNTVAELSLVPPLLVQRDCVRAARGEAAPAAGTVGRPRRRR
jgi:hypothetical protein